MKKQLNYKNILTETLILTGAIAIISAAVYFFLVPSHTTAIVCDHHDSERCTLDHCIYHLWQGIRSKNSLHQHHAPGLSWNIRKNLP